MTRACASCGGEIGAARLRAIPDTAECIACAGLHSDDDRVKGLMVWDGKSAPDIEIGTALAVEQAGAKRRVGAQLEFDQIDTRTGKGLGPEAQEENAMRELGERLRREARGIPEPDANLVPVLRESEAARCHPARPRIGLSGLCIDCALAAQARRVRR